MPDIKGKSGYLDSTITVTIGGVYNGGGTGGYAGGVSYTFAVASRSFPQVRPRHTTTDTGFEEAVPGPVRADVRIRGYFKGDDLPPDLFSNAYIKIVGKIGTKNFIGVVLVENFSPVGDVTKAQDWELTGSTDGLYTWA